MKCVDSACGALWLNPMPAPIDIWMAYETYYTHADRRASSSILGFLYRNAAQGHLANRFRLELKSTRWWQRTIGLLFWLMPAKRLQIELGLDALQHQRKGSILEVGCGSGALIEKLKRWGWKVEGIDVDAKAVANASAKGLNVSVGDVISKKYPPASFDAVISSHVLEHLHNPKDVLSECLRILKPNGLIVVVTPNASSWGHKRFGAAWFPLDPPRHLCIHTPLSLRKISEESGIRVLTLKTSVRSLDDIFIASRKIQSEGHYTIGTYTRRQILALQVFVLLHTLRLVFDPLQGEELVMIGTPA